MKYSLFCLIAASALVVVGGVINFNTIRTSEYTIEVPARQSTANKIRIVFVSDFHIDTDTPESFIRKFVAKANQYYPDIVLFGGDIFEGRSSSDLECRTDLLKQISSKYGVYGVLGNHDYSGRGDKGDLFIQAGIKLLRDTVIVIEDKFYLAGRTESRFDGRKTVSELLLNTDDSLPVIMVDHRPVDYPEVVNSKTDIHLSGHTHNGQLFPINLIIKNMYVLIYGHLKIENTNFLVSSGIRLWRYPVRTVGKSEIMVIDMAFRNGK